MQDFCLAGILNFPWRSEVIPQSQRSKRRKGRRNVPSNIFAPRLTQQLLSRHYGELVYCSQWASGQSQGFMYYLPSGHNDTKSQLYFKSLLDAAQAQWELLFPRSTSLLHRLIFLFMLLIQTIKPLCLPSSQNLKGPRSTWRSDSRAPQSLSPAQRPSDRCQVGFQQPRVPFVCES